MTRLENGLRKQAGGASDTEIQPSPVPATSMCALSQVRTFGFYYSITRLLPRERQRQSAGVLAQKLKASESAPTKMRLRAQMASRLNQLRDTNLRPR